MKMSMQKKMVCQWCSLDNVTFARVWKEILGLTGLLETGHNDFTISKAWLGLNTRTAGIVATPCSFARREANGERAVIFVRCYHCRAESSSNNIEATELLPIALVFGESSKAEIKK